MCPVCCLCTYLIHRLCMIPRPLEGKDFLFIFQGTKPFYPPVTSDIVGKTLKLIASSLGFYHLRSHNFKHGILFSLYQAAEDELLQTSIRFFLCVADHKPDYHQDYIVPDLVKVAEKIHYLRYLRIQEFRGEFKKEFAKLELSLRRLFPLQADNTTFSQQKTIPQVTREHAF